MTTTTATPASQDAPATKPLTFTWVYKYDPGELLPEEGRAAWLEKYGVPPDRAEVQVTLPLTTWEALGFVIQPHGVVNITTCPSSYKYDRPAKFAIRVALAFARASIQAGVVPGTFPGEAFCAAYQAERDETYARWHLLVEQFMAALQPTNGFRLYADGRTRYDSPAFDENMRLDGLIHEVPEDLRVVPPQHQAWARQVLATHKRAQEEQAARNEAAAAQRNAQQEMALEYFNRLEKEALKAAVYGLGVPQVATTSQRERFEAGVLPSEEAHALLDTLALGPIEGLDADVPFSADNICAYGRKVRFTKDEVAEYPASAWELRKKVVELLPDADCVLTLHRAGCECDDDDCTVHVRHSLLVRARAPHGQVYSRRLKI